MDFEKLLEFIKNHLSEYLSVLGSTLKKPKLKYYPIQSANESQQNLVFEESKEKTKNQLINPNLFEFAFISIFLGVTLQTLLPGNETGQNLLIVVLIPLIAWLIVGILIHLVCNGLKGKGNFAETVSLCLQIFAVAYIFCSVITFIWGIITIGVGQYSPLPIPNLNEVKNGEVKIPFYEFPPFKNYYLLLTYPLLLYFVIHPIFLLVYISWGLKILHRFNKYKLGIVMLALIIILIPFLFVNTITYEGYATIISPTR